MPLTARLADNVQNHVPVPRLSITQTAAEVLPPQQRWNAMHHYSTQAHSQAHCSHDFKHECMQSNVAGGFALGW